MFAVAIIALVGQFLLTNIGEQFTKDNALSDEGQAIYDSISDRYAGVIDNGFLMIFVGTLLATIIGAWLINTSPALFYISVPILAFIIFLGAIYGNVWGNIIATDDFAAASTQFTIIPFLLNNFVLVVTVSILAISLALFAKNPGAPK